MHIKVSVRLYGCIIVKHSFKIFQNNYFITFNILYAFQVIRIYNKRLANPVTRDIHV